MPITATALLRLWDMACLACLWSPLRDSLLAGQEHGRTIPCGSLARGVSQITQ